MPLRCQIITQERMLFDEDVDIVIAPGSEGEMGVLPNHAPIVAALNYGELIVRQGEMSEAFAIGGGVLQVAHNKVVVLADSAESADEIDIARAQEARQKAERSMREGVVEDEAQLAALEAAIRRANLRLKVAHKHRPERRGRGPGAMDFE
jgi:F-type H+-transporting ATPase subunit epsilon